jgi:hypothetical protein
MLNPQSANSQSSLVFLSANFSPLDCGDFVSQLMAKPAKIRPQGFSVKFFLLQIRTRAFEAYIL